VNEVTVGKRRLRIGMLGCANVAAYALLAPWREGAAIEVVAVAGRDPARARAYAAGHGIAAVFDSYAALIDQADVDAIYVAVPNGLHGRWAIAALRGGYPVLCEKPLAANAAEARRMAEAADAAGLALVEAVHWRDHPAAARIADLLRGLGRLRSMDLRYSLPGGFLPPDDIRFSPSLAGGWLMDQGCYCISFARYFAGEPEAVVSARAVEERPGVDGGMDIVLRFAGDVVARIGGSMIDRGVTRLELGATFVCEGGVLSVSDPYLPGANPFTHRQGAVIAIDRADGTRHREVADLVSSWRCQADMFAALVRGWQAGDVNPAWDGVATMRVIDAIYAAAGLAPRQPAA
jgi:predicted dehydrogenase